MGQNNGGLDSLITILDKAHATEFIVFIEPGLVPTLSSIAPYSTLQSHGVRTLIPLTNKSVKSKQPEGSAILYLTRASPSSLSLVSQSAKLHIGATMTVVVTPEVPPSVPLLLTNSGILGDVDLVPWPVSLIPDVTVPNLLTLCHTESASDPKEGVWPLAWALDALQANETGAFGKVTAVGPRARNLASLLEQKRAEHAVIIQQQQLLPNERGAPSSAADYHFGYSSSTFFGSEVEHAIIIDRDIDLVTPLLCQTTYEGVLAETLGISSSGTTQNGLKVSLRDDPVFASIAERPFAEGCESLHQSAKRLQQEYREGNSSAATNSAETSNQSLSITEIRNLVSKLGSLQATQRLVNTQTELASLAMAGLEKDVRRQAYDLQTRILESRTTNTQAVAQIQDLVFQGTPLALVLRLLSLLCLVRGGLKASVLQTMLYGDILRTYGYEHLESIHYLYERGLIFSPRGSSFLFSAAPLASLASFGSGSSSNTPNTNAQAAQRTGKPNFGNLNTGFQDDSLGSNLPQTYPWYTSNKAYKVFPSESPEAQPYVGIVPLTARIVQMALGVIPKVKTPLEPEFAEYVYTPKNAIAAREAKLRRTLTRNAANSSPIDNAPTVLVVVIGGVTYAEATAIKTAAASASSESHLKRIVVVSTSIITGDSIVLRKQAPHL